MKYKIGRMTNYIFFAILGYIISSGTTFVICLLQVNGNSKTAENMIAGGLIVGTVCVLVIAPVVEELLFRRCLYTFLYKILHMNFWCAAGISSITFGLLHYPIAATIAAIITGMILCYIYHNTQNIGYCIVYHFGYNLFSLISLIFGILSVIIFMMIIGLTTLYICGKNRKNRKAQK